jgi:hypothetical protein
LDDPPVWLVEQLPKCVNEPHRWLRSTAHRMADELRPDDEKPTAEDDATCRRVLVAYLDALRRAAMA